MKVAGSNTQGLTLKEKILLTAGGTLTAVGLFFVGRKVLRSATSNNEEKKSFKEDSPATLAKQIKMAFENDGWPGTNTKELRRILRDVPSKEAMTRVADSYRKLYAGQLYKDMGSELQSTEYSEMLSIIDAKPDRVEKKNKGVAVKPGARQHEQWAKRLKSSFEKSYGPLPGTDEDALKAVLDEVPTQGDFIQVAAHYKLLYKTNLLDDLKSEGSLDEYNEWMKMVLSKPK